MRKFLRSAAFAGAGLALSALAAPVLLAGGAGAATTTTPVVKSVTLTNTSSGTTVVATVGELVIVDLTGGTVHWTEPATAPVASAAAPVLVRESGSTSSNGSATATFDDAGSWVAGSYVHATARDYARFGLLYLRDGTWDGRRILPEGWVDHGRRPRSVDPEDGDYYGSHWWTRDGPHGTFWASGHEGQHIDICPASDLVLVRMGRTGSDRSPRVRAWRDQVIAAVAEGLPTVGDA